LELAYGVERFYRDRRKTIARLGKSIADDIDDTHSRGGWFSHPIFVYKSLELQTSDLEISSALYVHDSG